MKNSSHLCWTETASLSPVTARYERKNLRNVVQVAGEGDEPFAPIQPPASRGEVGERRVEKQGAGATGRGPAL